MTVAVDELRRIDLLADLDDDLIERWSAALDEQMYSPGDYLVRAGEVDPPFAILFEGQVDVLFMVDGHEERAHIQLAPTWMGAIMALTGEPSAVAFRVAEPSRVATVPAEEFRQLLFATPSAFRRVMAAFRTIYTRVEAAELQKEKLAALGTMSAGLAHELGNPAAAALRTASALGEALESLGGIVGRLVEAGVDHEEAVALVRLHDQAIASATEHRAVDALAAAEEEEAMADVLEAHGVPDRWRYAEPLAASGLDEAWMSDVARVAGPALPAVVEWVSASINARTLTDELRESTERMTRLVRAIKAYSYMDQAALQEIDVHDGLEATIAILHHKLKRTEIKIDRRYAEGLPTVCVYGSELNQVWTNLLDNAIDSLGDSGTIIIETEPWHETGVEVRITDDGPGIPEDHQHRIFDPFFTTKAVGAGTGLGLDTARRIVVDRHEGDLRFTSKPGETVFTVRLPRAPRRSESD
jgi:signal transduction histidine kinase